jgi:hypothetical protein
MWKSILIRDKNLNIQLIIYFTKNKLIKRAHNLRLITLEEGKHNFSFSFYILIFFCLLLDPHILQIILIEV